jgi:hypothetical protein
MSASSLKQLQRRFSPRDHIHLRTLLARGQKFSAETLLRKALKTPSRVERSAMIHYRDLPAPAALDTENPSINDDLLEAVVKLRLQTPRWEGAWHLRGDIRVAATSPLVFVDNRLMAPSAGFHETDDRILPHYLARLKGRRSVVLKRALLLRDYWDRNYWHLRQNVFPRLALADALKIPADVPVVVSESFMQRYSKLLEATRLLENREVFVQPRRHDLRCEELFLLVPGEYSPDWAGRIDDRIPGGPSDIPNSTRIYCRRSASASHGRVVENDQEVEDLFRTAGFAIVDPGSMTIAVQKTVFQNAEVVAGIGGAAFANARFRHHKPLTIGVLMASSALSTEIPAFAKAFGFRFVGQVFPSTGPMRAASVLIPRDAVSGLIERIS